jgi:tRNA(fMet)-specific endonuclease VapC
MSHLLDTNVISDFVRGNTGVRDRLLSMAPGDLAVSTITRMEIDFGLALDLGRTRRLRPPLEALLGSIATLEFSREDARAAANLRAALQRRGRPVGPYDVLIAGAALARGLVLVTANTKELSRIEGLILENWRA